MKPVEPCRPDGFPDAQERTGCRKPIVQRSWHLINRPAEEKGSMKTVVPEIPEETTQMVRGRRQKAKIPTRLERVELLRALILQLRDDLIEAGFGASMPEPGAVKFTEDPDEDPLIGGKIGKVKEPLGTYIQRVSIADNFSQRPPFDHTKDSIYRRLIKDFIAGAAMPESKIAGLSRTSSDKKIAALDSPADIQFSVIDGLQRLYCFCIALLLLWKREQLVSDGVIPADAWEYFKDAVEEAGDPKTATERLLRRPIRYEVFYHIDLAGLLHYMVTFNTGQRRMSLGVQLEIMRRPLIEELKREAKIPVWEDIQKIPGMTKPKEQFSAGDLVLATRAFITANAQVTAAEEAEQLLEDQAFLENVGEISDVVRTFKRLVTEIQPEIARVYADDINKRYLLSNSSLFLLGLSAACGYLRNKKNMKMLDGALDSVLSLLKRKVEDPLNLEEYTEALNKITTSRGKAIRRLVNDTFQRFFLGATTELEWLDTVQD
jgi:hypothetical protein